MKWMILGLVGVIVTGCSGVDERPDSELILGGQTKMTRAEDGNWLQEFDVDGDGRVDVTKVMEEYPDPNDPSVTKTRMIEKRVDVNSDGKLNIVRKYNEEGRVMLEDVDTDLDGIFDFRNHLDAGRIVKKELYDAEGRIVATRYYDKGEIQRVEKDTTGDQKVDYWEFYEQGVLDRIGRDLNADGRADTWQTQ